MSEKVDWNKLTMPLLKDELKKRGLDQAGKKADLVSRLEALEGGGGEPTGTTVKAEDDDVVVLLNDDDDEPEVENGTATEEMETSQVEDEKTKTKGNVDDGEEKEGKEGEEKEVKGEKKEGDEENKPEETEAKPNEAEQVSSQYSVEMKRDRDSFQLTWHGKKFTVPFRGEIHSDLAAHMSARSFLVKPIDVDDIRSEKFQEMINSCHQFTVEFRDKQFKKVSSGYARFVFATAEEAEKYKEDLKAYKETLTFDPVKFDDDFGPVHFKEQPSDGGSIVERLLYVGNLPNDVTEPTVRELFPDALQVIFPLRKEILDENAENFEKTRYAYLEYANSEDATKAAEENKDKLLEEDKLFVIKAITVRKEKYGLLTDTLRMILLDKIRKMRKIQKNPYNKSRQELNEIEKAINQNLEKLHSDSAHRKSWGMELGPLDESRLDTEEEPEKIGSINQSHRGRGRGGRGHSTSMYGSGPRRGGGGGMSGMGQGYGGYGGGYGGGQAGYGRGGWNQGGYGSSGFYAAGFANQSYGGGFNAQGGNFSGKRRAANDGYGGDWKRSRGRGGYGGY